MFPSRARLRRAVALAVAIGLAFGGCTTASHSSRAAVATGSLGAMLSPARLPSMSDATTEVSQPLVRWTGPVEHVFFHSLIIRPELAFTKDRLAQGFRDYFVTVGEFRAILDQLYANRWTLVDIHRAAAGNVEVPPGRRPLVLSEDDVNYYDYSRPRGLGWRLVLDAAGEVKIEIRDNRGVRVTDEDLVPMVDEFVATHPSFSADGAKGVLALTGYEGLFGERINDRSSPTWSASVSRASAIAARLRATGWTFASHSYGHIDLTRTAVNQARVDALRWLAEATPIVGHTDVYVYPFGAALPPASVTDQMLRQLGFTIQCDIDPVARLVRSDGIIVTSRRHIDGIAFDQQAAGLARFFSVSTVEDRAARRR